MSNLPIIISAKRCTLLHPSEIYLFVSHQQDDDSLGKTPLLWPPPSRVLLRSDVLKPDTSNDKINYIIISH